LEISLQKDARACYRILKEHSGRDNAPLENGTEEDRTNQNHRREVETCDRRCSWKARITSDRHGVCHGM